MKELTGEEFGVYVKRILPGGLASSDGKYSQGTFPYHDIPGFFLVLQFKCNYYPKSRVHIIERESKNNTVKQERQSIKGTIQQKKIHLISSGCYVLYYLPFPPIKSSSNFW